MTKGIEERSKLTVEERILLLEKDSLRQEMCYIPGIMENGITTAKTISCLRKELEDLKCLVGDTQIKGLLSIIEGVKRISNGGGN